MRQTDAPRSSRSAFPAVTRAKWRAFRLLEALSDLRGNAVAGRMALRLPEVPVDALWVFASTIGELNAIEPFLRRLAARTAPLKLVLITDHPHYRDSYLARYPEAEVCVTLGHGDDARTLAMHYPPRMLVVAEIPCLPSDAPCRFSFAFLLEARRAKAPAVVVNGWLYHYQPACRMDGVERRWFAGDYLRAFEVICAQTDDCAQRLLSAGARPGSVTVTGNIKFDAMRRQGWHADHARSPRLLGSLVDAARPVIVAGSVTSEPEQQAVLQAFARVRQQHPAALLVLAPRHPEVAARMQALRALLDVYGLVARFRSSLDDGALADDVNCLVLDTMGDLRDFYSASTVAHVGVDHNVLEPLSFGKPVTVMPGWEATYPSWPVYFGLMKHQALLDAADADALFGHWRALLASPADAAMVVARAEQALAVERGAVDRHFTAIEPCLARIGAAPGAPFAAASGAAAT